MFVETSKIYERVAVDEKGEHWRQVVQWRPGDDWEPKVRALLERAKEVE